MTVRKLQTAYSTIILWRQQRIDLRVKTHRVFHTKSMTLYLKFWRPYERKDKVVTSRVYLCGFCGGSLF